MNLVSRMNVVKLLVTKNWKIRLHYKKSFALLFLMPILLTALIVILTYTRPAIWLGRDAPTDESHFGDRIFVYNASTLFSQWMPLKQQTFSLFYSPNNSYTNHLMQRVAKLLTEKFEFRSVFDIKGYHNEELMDKGIEIYSKQKK